MDIISQTQEIIDRHAGEEGVVMTILQEAHDEFGYLPQESIEHIAVSTGINLSRLYGLITFYSQFHLKPRGKNILKVCCGTACHVKGADRSLTKIQEKLKITDGETTSDGKFTLERIACMGACGLAPILTINDEVHKHATSTKIDKILKKYE